MQQDLIEAISGGVATLTLTRPDRHTALSAPIMEGLLEALPRLAADPTVGAIVLTHRERKDNRGSQNIARQIARKPSEATVNTRPEVGQGIKL